jgi:hypothetical protein
MKPFKPPSLATILRETDPAKRKRDLDQALANAERPTPPDFWRDGAADEEPFELPETRAKEAAAARTRRARTRGFFLAFALLAVGAPVAVALVGRGKVAPVPSAADAVQASATPRATAAESVTAAPSAAAAPSTTAATAATAVPSATARALPAATAPSTPSARTRPRATVENPYDGPPSHATAMPSTPPPAAPPPPTPKAPDTDPDGFAHKVPQ